MTKFTDTALTPAATTKLAAELADGSKGHVLQSALRDLLRQQGEFYTIGASAVAVPLTGTVAKTALATVTIPAGAMGANGILRLWTLWSLTGSTNSKTLSAELGGTAFFSRAETGGTVVSMRDQRDIQNRNSQSSQICWRSTTQGGFGQGTGALTTGTVNTANAQDLIIYGQLASSGETITLESYIVELQYRA